MHNHRSRSRRHLCGCARVIVLFSILQTATALDAAAQMDHSRNWIARSRPFAEADESDQSAGWGFEVAPYLWAAGLDGTVGVLGRTAHVDVGFGEIVEDLDFALMLATELHKGRWGVGGDVIYIQLSKDAAVPRPPVTGIDFEQSQLLLELSPRYRVIARQSWSLDALAGVRFMSLKPTLTVEPEGDEFAKRRSWADPIVGARLGADAGRHWRGQLRADIGGFGVGSELTWQVEAIAGYHISERVTLAAAYRYLDMDYENTDDEFLYDVAMHGPILGVVIAFGPRSSRRP